MSDEMKPREFSIAVNTNNWLSGDREDEYCETIHVIEKSAYDELARKLEIAKRAMKNAKKCCMASSEECCLVDALKEIER